MLRADEKLADMLILRRGNRLSITPVESKHWDRICKLGGI
jgi:predicted RNA-binding protein with PUA-like domain